MKSNKIVIISSNSLLEQVTKNRLLPMMQLLNEKNISITLVCPKDDMNRSELERINITEVEISQKKVNSFVLRAMKELYNSYLLLETAKKEKAQGYLITIPSMFLTFLSPVILFRENVFLDIRDLTWEYLSDEHLLQRLSKKVFRFAFFRTLNFNRLVAVTNAHEYEYVENIWKGVSKPFLVSNGIMQSQFKKLSQVDASKNEKFTITYIGNIGIAQNLNTLVLAAELLPDFDFIIVGSGIEYDKIYKVIESKSLNNIHLTGRVPWSKVKEYYDNTDILYAQLIPDFSGAMPSKLYEYLSTGKYIIYGGQGQAVETLTAFENIEVIDPNNHITLAHTVKELFNKKTYKILSLNNKKLIKNNYIRENNNKKFIEAIKKTIKDKRK